MGSADQSEGRGNAPARAGPGNTSNLRLQRRASGVRTLFRAAALTLLLYVVLTIWARQYPARPGSDPKEIGIAVSPSGEVLYFSVRGTRSVGVYRLDLKDRKVRRMCSLAPGSFGIEAMPDGRRLAFTRENTRDDLGGPILCCGLDGTGLRLLAGDEATYSNGIRFASRSPACVVSNMLLRHTWRGDRWTTGRVLFAPAEGKAPRAITPPVFLQYVAISPDATMFAYTAVDGDEYAEQLFVGRVNGATGGATRIYPGRDSVRDPQFTPDGRRIVFIVTPRAGDYLERSEAGIWSIGVDGRDARPVITGRHDVYQIRLTPDGRTVLYLEAVSSRTWDFDLMAIDVDGGNPRQIADSSLFDEPLGWRPSGPSATRQ